MNNHQQFATNSFYGIAAVNLITVYNTHTYGYYKNTLLKDPHKMYCAILTLEGNAEIQLNSGERISLSKNSLFLGSHANVRTLFSECEHWHFTCYWFIPHNINLPVNKVFGLKNFNAEAENAEATKIIQLMQTRIETKIHYANSYFCCRLLNYLEDLNPYVKKSTEMTEKIVYFINTHLEEDLQVSDIADKFGYCEKHIRHLFKSTLGMGPKQYINKVKLENIRNQLSTTALSLQKLADKYAFASASHLINNFKKEYGITPTDYRNTK